MAGERGSAVAAGTAVVIMLGMSMLFHCHVADAAQYTVDWGLSPKVKNHQGNTFQLNDKLYFNFSASYHNVYIVDENGYKTCKAAPRSTTLKPNTPITLSKKKTYYFICTVSGHCTPNNVGPTAGMKLAVTVA